eukprot:3163106-Pleurochrysis_carterae.AAC.1
MGKGEWEKTEEKEKKKEEMKGDTEREQGKRERRQYRRAGKISGRAFTNQPLRRFTSVASTF